MSCYYTQYHSDNAISWIPLLVNSKDGIYFAMLFTLRRLHVGVIPNVRFHFLKCQAGSHHEKGIHIHGDFYVSVGSVRL